MNPLSPKRRPPVHLVATLVLALSSGGCLAMGLATRGAPEGELRSIELELAPVDLPATTAAEWEDGSGREVGLPTTSSEAHEEHGSVVPPPLRTTVTVDGWLHGFDFRVLDESGEEVAPEVLHHLKVMAPERRELFSPLMLRLAGAGSETEPVLLPTQVGYPLSKGDSLLVTAMLHNPTGEDLRGLRVSIRMHYTPEGSWRDPAEIVPFFTHVTSPGEETSYDLPHGRSERSIQVQPAVSGTILGLGGHLHRYGVSLRLEESATGRVLWEGEAIRDPERPHLPRHGRLRESHRPDSARRWNGDPGGHRPSRRATARRGPGSPGLPLGHSA